MPERQAIGMPPSRPTVSSDSKWQMPDEWRRPGNSTRHDIGRDMTKPARRHRIGGPDDGAGESEDVAGLDGRKRQAFALLSRLRTAPPIPAPSPRRCASPHRRRGSRASIALTSTPGVADAEVDEPRAADTVPTAVAEAARRLKRPVTIPSCRRQDVIAAS